MWRPPPGCRALIRAGVQELTAQEASGAEDDPGRVRRRGAGRKRLTAHDPSLEQALERLVDPVTRGDPMGPLRWTCSSAARLVTELQAQGHAVSERTVNRLLHELGYSLQANRKTLEGNQHADVMAIQTDQPKGAGVSAAAATGSVGRHQEEGIGQATVGESGDRREHRSRRCTILSIRVWARRFRMGSMT